LPANLNDSVLRLAAWCTRRLARRPDRTRREPRRRAVAFLIEASQRLGFDLIKVDPNDIPACPPRSHSLLVRRPLSAATCSACCAAGRSAAARPGGADGRPRGALLDFPRRTSTSACARLSPRRGRTPAASLPASGPARPRRGARGMSTRPSADALPRRTTGALALPAALDTPRQPVESPSPVRKIRTHPVGAVGAPGAHAEIECTAHRRVLIACGAARTTPRRFERGCPPAVRSVRRGSAAVDGAQLDAETRDVPLSFSARVAYHAVAARPRRHRRRW